MSDDPLTPYTALTSAVIVAARPQAIAALLRYFRDLDSAEEAFQEACLRALSAWPKNGRPRDAAAWLIMVGRTRHASPSTALSRLRIRRRLPRISASSLTGWRRPAPRAERTGPLAGFPHRLCRDADPSFVLGAKA